MLRGEQDDWCILTTAGTRTLALARSLAAAGIEAWTPQRTEHRTGRGKKRKEVVQIDVAITPTFVFVRAKHLPELFRIRDLPVSPHPAFRMLRHRDRVPVIRDSSLAALRAAEERFAVSALKAVRRRIAPGTAVHLKKGAWAGLTGVVEGSTDRDAKVVLANGFSITIASWLFGTDAVQSAGGPALGLAA